MSSKENVLVVGGTGFLGYHAIQAILERGWTATALGLPPAPPSGLFPASVKVVLENIEAASDKQLLDLLAGHTALVYAAGLDDRVTPKAPAYPKFYRANVEIPLRLFTLARQAGLRRAVVLGSYFAHFHRLWPELNLGGRHPYIHSRLEQEKRLTSIPGLETCVLELPYIFGSLPVPGWKPLWAPLLAYLLASRLIFYMHGGTACVSARTVGRAIQACLERGEAGRAYPVGGENLTWTDLLTRLADAAGRRIQVIALPKGIVRLGLYATWAFHKLQGREGGLDPRFFAPLQTAETYLDPQPSERDLGFRSEALDQAFRDTVEADTLYRSKK